MSSKPTKTKGPTKRGSAEQRAEVDLLVRQHQEEFLGAFLTVGYVSAASRLCGQSRDNHYGWLEGNTLGYRKRFADALEFSVETVEAELREQALLGVEEEIVYEGELTGESVRRKSFPALRLLLQSLRPEKYGRETPRQGGVDVGVPTQGNTVVIIVQDGQRLPGGEGERVPVGSGEATLPILGKSVVIEATKLLTSSAGKVTAE
jgi:hypothetical protein